MLEFIILSRLCNRIGRLAREKSRRPIYYKLMLIYFWFSGQIGVTILFGAALYLILGDRFEQFLWLGYITAFAGGAWGAWISFRIVGVLPERSLSGEARPS